MSARCLGVPVALSMAAFQPERCPCVGPRTIQHVVVVRGVQGCEERLFEHRRIGTTAFGEIGRIASEILDPPMDCRDTRVLVLPDGPPLRERCA